ncbi:MAG: hypothetical protein ED556_07770 [Winogradskyella sp.]|uniref:BatA domain-containing protein n=1 Tax=Winogradskyella sp. TaxID=1883156 RepID=UPI000F419E97|nr:BatA domain-containing protein [Winogradskyella sp.]RNC87305.1 MAG: hypothetical protein ED556_07770 [Winogradskyella sp.]
MQFKHPEILWALLLLLIPIIIHLFQLRRFQKVAFTNVKFLKNVKLQTRKSSQIKRWLTLLARLLLFACLIIAFAQPFTSNSNTFNAKNETVIYLDNSFSMESKGNNGSLLNESIQGILNTYSDDDELTIYTNDKTFRNTTIKSVANDLISLKHSTNQLSYNSAYLKGKQYFSKDNSSVKNLVLVSDFQQKDEQFEFPIDSSITLHLVQPKAVYRNNISIDSVYASKFNSETIELTAKLSQQGEPITNVSVSLYDGETLNSKTAVDIDKEAETTFTIPSNTIFKGELSLEDAGLQYDNSLYFNINAPDKINVLSINEASDDFLQRIYTDDEFNYTSFQSNAIDFSRFESQNLIILNELTNISNALINTLNTIKSDGVSIIIIPSSNINLNSYNQLLNNLNLSRIVQESAIPKQVTTINYDHPILRDAFYNRVNNFQYPKVNSYYNFNSTSNYILRFEDGNPFLVNNTNSYLFSAAINEGNSNFKKSPLIVPVLYNIGKKSLALPDLYYRIGTENTIDINIKLPQDRIINLENGGETVIPQQQTFSNKVTLKTREYPDKDGIVNVMNANELLSQLSFNYQRNESKLIYHNIEKSVNYSLNQNLISTIDTIKSNARINALWKWFVIFALAFLIIEMLILKYLK